METHWRAELERFSEYFSFRIIFLAILVGIISGGFAVLFYHAVELIFEIMVNIPYIMITNSSFSSFRWMVLLLSPALGGIVVGLISKKISKESKGHGVPNVIYAYHMNGGIMDKSIPLSKFVLSTLTLGSGGCAGKEGPVVQMGAGIGSYIAQKFNLEEKERQLLLLCGLSACLGATFNAPIGATLFAIEIIRPKISLKVYPIILISTVASIFFNYFTVGDTVLLKQSLILDFIDWNFIALSLLIGIFCGIFSALWIRMFYNVEIKLHKKFEIFNIPSKYQPAFGGLLVGLLLCVIYMLVGDNWISYSISGYTLKPMNEILNGNLLSGEPTVVFGILIMIMVFKIIGTAFTLGSGGSGGVFAPTLFIGMFFGAAFGILSEILLQIPIEYEIAFSLLGMAAFLSGSYRAPLTAIILTAEICDNFLIVVPLMVASSMGYIFSFLIQSDDINQMDFKLQGISLKHLSLQSLDKHAVHEFMYPMKFFNTAQVNTPIPKAIELMKKNTITALPILNKNKYISLVVNRDIKEFQEQNLNWESCTMKDLIKFFQMKPNIMVTKSTPLLEAVTLMALNDISNLPVVEKDVDDSLKLVGWFDNKILSKLEKEGLNTRTENAKNNEHAFDLDDTQNLFE